MPNIRFSAKEGYHRSGSSSFEIFWGPEDNDPNWNGPGWYWWPCFPGCLPDGDPVGPFNSSSAAYADARG